MSRLDRRTFVETAATSVALIVPATTAAQPAKTGPGPPARPGKEGRSEQKAVSGLVPAYFDSHGWRFGLSVTRRVDVAGSVGQYGWDGGLGTSWRSDPSEDMVTILLTQRAWTSPSPPDVCLDFWTSAYQAIDD